MEEQGTSPRESYRIEWEHEGRKFAAVGPDLTAVVALYSGFEWRDKHVQEASAESRRLYATVKLPLTPEKPAEPTMPAAIASARDGVLYVIVNKRGEHYEWNFADPNGSKHMAAAINCAILNAVNDKREACAALIESFAKSSSHLSIQFLATAIRDCK
jgi:hypothetical protein